MNAAGKSPNCDLKFLSKDKKDYVTNDFCKRYYKKGYPSIKSCQEQTKELGKKYSLKEVKEKANLSSR